MIILFISGLWFAFHYSWVITTSLLNGKNIWIGGHNKDILNNTDEDQWLLALYSVCQQSTI